MQRLPVPKFDPWETTLAATSKFVGHALQARVVAAKPFLQKLYDDYANASKKAEWYNLSSCLHGKKEQVIVSDLQKAELTCLYSTGMVNGTPAARDLYDQIKVAAGGKCPYCGGIGDVDPLDHYLPKSRYPQFAVLPTNLVPCCDRCNKLSGSGAVRRREEQTLHPYFDANNFFFDPWVSVVFDEPDIFRYRYVFDPPIGWSNVDKARAKKHFIDFKLAARYGATASQEVSYLISDFTPLMRRISDKCSVRSQLESKSRSLSYPLNGWVRPLYRALSQADWFLSAFG